TPVPDSRVPRPELRLALGPRSPGWAAHVEERGAEVLVEDEPSAAAEPARFPFATAAAPGAPVARTRLDGARAGIDPARPREPPARELPPLPAASEHTAVPEGDTIPYAQSVPQPYGGENAAPPIDRLRPRRSSRLRCRS